MLKPNNAWTWFFDTQLQRLMLNLGHKVVFTVAIEKKNLIPDAFDGGAFSVEDAAGFQTYWDTVQYLSLADEQKKTLVLNAVAARRFHKPFLPKSWFFDPQPTSQSPLEGALVELTTAFGVGRFIVIENSGNASLCMLAQEQALMLSEDKSLGYCETIKVMNDRFFIVTTEPTNPFALVV